MVRTTHVLLNPFDDTGKLPDDDGIESDSSLATDDASSVDLSEEATDNSEDEGSNEGERNTNADDDTMRKLCNSQHVQNIATTHR